MKISLLLFSIGSAVVASAASVGPEIVCAGDYPYHPQGVATDGTNIYWSFTTVLVKTDLSGKVQATFDEKDKWMGHVGDLCCKDGHLFAGVNRGFEKGIRPGDEVWEFDAALNVVKKYPTPEMIWCNNGLEWFGGSFWLVSAAPDRCIYNFLFEYTSDFKFKRCMPIKSGWTYVGVQTVLLYGDKLLFGCYGAGNDAEMPHPLTTFVVDTKKLPPYKASDHPPLVPCEGRIDRMNASCGMLTLNGRFMLLVPINKCPKEPRPKWRWTAKLVPYDVDAKLGRLEGGSK